MKKMSKSLRKYIRRQKAIIRKKYLDPHDQEKAIQELLDRLIRR